MPKRKGEAEAHRPRHPRRQRPKLSNEEAKQLLDRAVESWRARLSPRRVKWDMPERLEALAAARREGDAEAIQRAEAKARELAGLAVTVDYSGLPSEVQRKLGVPQSSDECLQRVEDLARKDLERHDALVREKHEVLLALTRKGANPAYILSVLIRYAGKRTTEFPEFLTIPISGKLLTDYALEAERPLPLLAGAPARVTFKKDRRIPGREKPGKPNVGPAELAVSAGMALLYRHFTRTTARPHAKEIGRLFNLRESWNVLGPGPSVYRRVRRLRTKYGKKIGRLIRDEKTLFRALTGTDLAL